MQLLAADIDRNDMVRSALEQNIGEAARRGADIQAIPAGGVEAEGIERAGEL